MIFINFRRYDDPGSAALLKCELARIVGNTRIFFAGTTIRPGQDFELELLRGVRRSKVLLAVIGSRWLTTPHPNGGRAIDYHSDWVRREIAEAFRHGVPVVPVLTHNAERLTGASLPSDVRRLTKCQYLRLRYQEVEHDLARIVAELTDIVRWSPRS